MIFDAHMHYLDFKQETKGFDFILKQMDDANVSHAIIFGIPLAKQWDEYTQIQRSNDYSRYYWYSATDYILLEQYQKQNEDVKKRLFPFVCGINPTDRNAVNHIRRLREVYPDSIYGVGEIFCRHGSQTHKLYGELPRADHPALMEVCDFAAENKLPVLVHNNISIAKNKDPMYLNEIVNLLSHNRKTNIIWAHIGAFGSVSVSDILEITERMLCENENLYCELSGAFYHYVQKNMLGWAELIMKHSTRFLLASDGMPPYSDYASYYIGRYSKLLDLVDFETKNKISYGNALRLLNVQIDKV